MLLGRTTWELFAKLCRPDRPLRHEDERHPHLVASRSRTEVGEWQNSALIDGDLVETVRRRKESQDVVVTGSVEVVRTLAAEQKGQGALLRYTGD